MAAATLQELRNMANGTLDGVSDAILNQYLADSYSQVTQYISVNNARFSYLQRLYCLFLLYQYGAFSGGDVQSETVGDVSITYGGGGGSAGSSGLPDYKKMFYMELEKVLGTVRRIC